MLDADSQLYVAVRKISFFDSSKFIYSEMFDKWGLNMCYSNKVFLFKKNQGFYFI